jgi:hypothetical protein
MAAATVLGVLICRFNTYSPEKSGFMLTPQAGAPPAETSQSIRCWYQKLSPKNYICHTITQALLL